jgi:hypothetical protein
LRDMTKQDFVDQVVAELVRRHNSAVLTQSVRTTAAT